MIRRMEVADLDQILELERVLFPDDGWDRSNYLYELNENPYATVLVEEENGIINGYIDWWIMYEQAQIANIAVRGTMQRRGLGAGLLRQAISDAIRNNCENISLEVRCSNSRAISLYEKSGFIKVSRRRNYYENGEDADLMVKPLGGLNDTDISN